MIRTIEELSMNAWPAMRTMHYGGWVLRFTDGYTRRANSVYPLYPSEMDVDEKIGFCESFYRDQGLPTIFKLTASSMPSNLDTRLSELGYRADARTSVQLMQLNRETHKIPASVDLTSDDSEIWHEAFARMNNVSVDRRVLHGHILRGILPEKRYISINTNGQILGCGLGVLQAGYLGIFDIVVASKHRGQGHGSRLMEALLAWGQEHKAHTAYLQVMCNNEPALRLYAKLGFEEKYQYWYRVKGIHR